MLRLAALLLVPLALVVRRRRRRRWPVAGRGRPAGTAWSTREGRPLRGHAGRDDDHRRRRADRATVGCSATRRSTAPSVFRSSPSTARPRALARRPHARARRRAGNAERDGASPSCARARSGSVKRGHRFKGRWAFDALSPDGRTLYALQYLGTARTRATTFAPSASSPASRSAPRSSTRREPDEEMHGAPGPARAARTAPGPTRSTSSRAEPPSCTR